MRKNLLFTIFISFSLLSGCNKDRPQPLPSLDSISPMEVAVGSTITLNGSGFSSTLNANQVTFNGVPGIVSAATSTQLTVTVPAGAFTDELLSAEVAVTTEGRHSSTPILLTSDRFPIITSIEPTSGPVGTIITIRGRHFNTDVNRNSVVFWNSSATPPFRTPLSASSTAIQVAIPSGTKTGDVCLQTFTSANKSRYYSGCQNFTVTP